jgi:hypothetical protein
MTILLSRVDVAGIAEVISATGEAELDGAEGQNRTVDTSLFRTRRRSNR